VAGRPTDDVNLSITIGHIYIVLRCGLTIFNGPFWALLVRCLSVCLSCLSVKLLYCGQTVGWIKIPLDTEVGLGSSNTMSPTSLPSGILIQSAVWPKQTWAKNWGLCPFGEGELGPHLTVWPGLRPTSMPSSIWQTILQTVAQKMIDLKAN